MHAHALKPPPEGPPGIVEPGMPLAGARRQRPPAGPRKHPDKGRSGIHAYYSVAIALGTLVVGLVSSVDPITGVVGAVGAGALCLLRRRVFALLVAAGMLGALFVVPPASLSLAYWVLIALLLVASVAPMRAAPSLLRVAPSTWAACFLLYAASICGVRLGTGALADYFVFQGCLCGALMGAGLTRHLAMVDARIVAWGEEGLTAVTRDLLLGRVTSGMLHDLSQPLNVISMANGNLGYIVEHLAIDDKARQQLLDRIGRISTHTENAASILSLFRWFGRNADQDEAVLSVRNALKRAVAATRSNVRYHGVEVEFEGNALDLLAPRQHGALEMMGVAALLSALGAYVSPEGERSKGRIVMLAAAEPARIVIEIHCVDEHAQPVACKPLDNATLWLVEQVAQEAGSDFRCLAHRKNQVQFAIRLEREDV